MCYYDICTSVLILTAALYLYLCSGKSEKLDGNHVSFYFVLLAGNYLNLITDECFASTTSFILLQDHGGWFVIYLTSEWLFRGISFYVMKMFLFNCVAAWILSICRIDVWVVRVLLKNIIKH